MQLKYNLNDDEFIMIANKTNINFEEGKLNMMINPEFSATINTKDNYDLDFACKGRGTIYFKSDDDSKELKFIKPLEFNGSSEFKFYLNNTKK